MARKKQFKYKKYFYRMKLYGQLHTQSMLDDIVDSVSQLTGEEIVGFIDNQEDYKWVQLI